MIFQSQALNNWLKDTSEIKTYEDMHIAFLDDSGTLFVVDHAEN